MNSYSNLHPKISEKLLHMERQRTEMLALSAYLSQAERIVKETFPEKDEAKDVYISFFGTNIYITISDITGLGDGTPLIRGLVRQGWRIEDRWDYDTQKTYRVRPTANGFFIYMSREIREGLDVTISLDLHVTQDENAPEYACRKVKIGETEELVKTPIYKVICPEGVEVLDVTTDGS